MNNVITDDATIITTNKQPIFILSLGRSGSTLMRYIVDSHPKIVCPGEIALGTLSEHLYHVAYYTIGQLAKATNSEREQVSLGKTRNIVISLMEEYTQAKGKEIWCERSPINLDHLTLIDKLFPNARYICLYRNALDVVYSLITFDRFNVMGPLVSYVQKYPNSFLSAMLEYWLEKNKVLLDFEQNHPRQCIRVKYEDLVEAPEKILAPMFTFLGMEWDPDLLNSIFSTQHDAGPGDKKLLFTNRIKSDSIGNGTAIPFHLLSDDYLTRINCIHEQLGYRSIECFYENCHSQAIHSITKTVSVSSPSENNETIFNFLKERAQSLETLGGECKLIVTGENGGMWMCSPIAPHVRALEIDEEAACTVVLSYESLMDILTNNQNPADIHDQGKIRVTGDLDLADQFGHRLLTYC